MSGFHSTPEALGALATPRENAGVPCVSKLTNQTPDMPGLTMPRSSSTKAMLLTSNLLNTVMPEMVSRAADRRAAER